jgi:hypothetical protein
MGANIKLGIDDTFLHGWVKNLSGASSPNWWTRLKAESTSLSVDERPTKEADICYGGMKRPSGLNMLRWSTCKKVEVIRNICIWLQMKSIGRKRFSIFNKIGLLWGRLIWRSSSQNIKRNFLGRRTLFFSLWMKIAILCGEWGVDWKNPEEEVFEAISQMEHNKALGLDGFPAESIKSSGRLLKLIY